MCCMSLPHQRSNSAHGVFSQFKNPKKNTMKRPVLPENPTPEQLKTHAEKMEAFANEQCEDRSFYHSRMWICFGLFILGLATCAYLGFGSGKSSKDSETLGLRNDEVRQLNDDKLRLESELTAANKAKEDADEAAKTARAEKAKVEEAAKKAEDAKSKSELAANDAKEKALKAESDAKESAGDLNKVKSDLTLALGGKTTAEAQKAEAERKVEDIRGQLQIAKDIIANLKAAPAQVIAVPAVQQPPVVIATPPSQELAVIAPQAGNLPAADDLGTPVLIRSNSPAPRGEKHYEGERVEVQLADGRKGFRIYHKNPTPLPVNRPPVRR